MTTENWQVVMLRKNFHFYHQWAFQQGTRSFAWHNSAINSESFVDKQFWQKIKFVSLWQQQAWRTILCEYNSGTFRISWHTHNYAEYKQHTENTKTSCEISLLLEFFQGAVAEDSD